MLKVCSVLFETDLNLPMFYYIGCYMYRNSSKTACPMSEIERFMLYRVWN